MRPKLCAMVNTCAKEWYIGKMETVMVKLKQRLIKLLDGYHWATQSRWKLVLGFGSFVLLVWLIAWHTDQFVRDLGQLGSTYGIPYWIVFLLASVLLLHEADYKWKRDWIKLPVGLLCVFYIHYCYLSLLWIIFAGISWMQPWVSNYASVLILLLSGVFTAAGFQNTNRIKTTRYEIAIQGMRGTGRIVLISDLHLGPFIRSGHVKRIVKKINVSSPELVIIAGDLIDEDHTILKNVKQREKIVRYFRQIQSQNGVLLTLGNHDPHADDPQFRDFLKECNMRLLHNEVADFHGYYIIGRSDPTHNDRKDIHMLLSQGTEHKPIIVADHNPQHIAEVMDAGVALVLCGHTHAGQFFPANMAVKWVVGSNRFYGHHIEGSTQTVISSGAGCFNLPIRLGSHNEIVEIDLMNDEGILESEHSVTSI